MSIAMTAGVLAATALTAGSPADAAQPARAVSTDGNLDLVEIQITVITQSQPETPTSPVETPAVDLTRTTAQVILPPVTRPHDDAPTDVAMRATASSEAPSASSIAQQDPAASPPGTSTSNAQPSGEQMADRAANATGTAAPDQAPSSTSSTPTASEPVEGAAPAEDPAVPIPAQVTLTSAPEPSSDGAQQEAPAPTSNVQPSGEQMAGRAVTTTGTADPDQAPSSTSTGSEDISRDAATPTAAASAATGRAPGTAGRSVSSAQLASSGVRGTLSGMPWKSGLFPMHRGEVVTAFEESRGAKADVVTVFPERTSWGSMMEGWIMDDQRIPPGFQGTLDVGVPLWPDDGDISTAATGGYNQSWEEFGRMVAAKYPDAYIRLGWEMNLPGWKHAATPENAEQWKQAYREAVTSIRRGGPGLRIAWVVNEGPGQTGTPDAREFYPGDEYVDFIGMDVYDWDPGYVDEASIAKHRDSEYGWNFWLDFAKQRGKKFVLPEWGIAPGSATSGGDNPTYIDFVYGWLGQNADWIEFESYFQESGAENRYALFVDNPKASAAYTRAIESLSR